MQEGWSSGRELGSWDGYALTFQGWLFTSQPSHQGVRNLKDKNFINPTTFFTLSMDALVLFY